ncbi:MAG: hypothetical protein HY890_06600, partial [Deltaproteobacteria bacterium]|nr:hypothetical protein [Deltaproteobacteria bacterium]
SAPEKYATAFGAFHTSAGIMLFPASAIGGILWDTAGPASTFLYGSMLALVAAFFFVIPVIPAKKSRG